MSDIKKLILGDSSKKASRRLAISDIHGCYKTFVALLDQIALKKSDYLFIVGDAVNRGPSSASILDHILELKANEFNIFYLRGNHEQFILNALDRKPKKAAKMIRNSNSGDLLDERIIKEKYHSLLNESYHYIELEDYFIVHAGFDFSLENPFEDSRSMLSINNFKANKKLLKYKQVVVGHKPKTLSKIIERVNLKKRKIYIDNGCVNARVSGQGNLLCFNLDTKAISIQKNLDS